MANVTHSAVCSCAPGTVCTLEVNAAGGAVAGQPGLMAAGHRTAWGGVNQLQRTVKVPCTSLTALMEGALLQGGANFLSLDVEGAEDVVLSNVDPAKFQVVVVEQDSFSDAKNARVRKRLESAGLRRHSDGTFVHSSDIYVQKGL